MDGTTVNLPRNPASPSFVCHDGIPKGVNQLHLTPLYDLLARTFADAVIQSEPQKDEIGALKLRKTENFNLFLRCIKNWAKQRKEEKEVEKSNKSA